ncbi:limonene-1,2-epoxide hydrolase family protein [Rhodococcus sp. NPDC003318]|uniref:limonene-1,2-epoxide hydrolase family protein n=1 Tax=Rhodococcus sp. NPDC003318 TaxID=3364503 RepID=UPI0036D1B8A0
MTPDAVVTEFCSRWADPDVETLVAYFTEGAVYHNIPMEPVVGKDAIREFLTGFVGQFGGIDFRIHRQASNGPVVMNERTDVLTMNGTTVELPVMGVFEVTEDGRISGWRDYFDMAPIAALG